MKFIHTADWHIGKIVNEFSMIDDQKHILEELIRLIDEEKPDALIIAGDIYDRSVPPTSAVELLDEIFYRIIIDKKTPILAIAGNHDSPERLGFACELLSRNGLFIEGVFKEDIRKVELYDKNGKVNFFLVPYADFAIVRDVLNEPAIKTQNEAMKKIVDNIKSKTKEGERNVLITHGFVRGLDEIEESESERPLSIGGTDYMDISLFEPFIYTALGHLHAPQRVGCDRVRYSGSLLKYSVSETRQKKSVSIVEIDGDGNVNVEQRFLNIRRDLRSIKGEIDSLLDPLVYADTNTDDYFHIVLTDRGELIDPIGKLRSVYKNIIRLDFEKNADKSNDEIAITWDECRQKSKLDLFSSFYKSMTDTELAEDGLSILSEIIEKVEKRGEDSYEAD